MGHHFSWRHDQVAKVEDCNSFIPSSNLGVASKQHSKVAQWWSTRLLTDRLRVRVPPLEPRCRSGGTGRRTGLKILRDLYSRTGSIPVFGTIFNIAEWSSWQLVGLITRRSEVQVLPPQPVNLISWLIGQAVKTPPFHGGNRGSIPL